MEEIQKNIYAVVAADEYDPFFDSDWAKQLSSQCVPSSKLDCYFFDFIILLRGVSTSFGFPLLSVKVAEAYAEGMKLHSLENSTVVSIIDHMVAKLESKVVLSTTQKRDILIAMHDIAVEFHEKLGSQEVDVDLNQLWYGLFNPTPEELKSGAKNTLGLGLWSSTRIAYCNLFFAYEDFLVRCISHKLNKMDFSTSKDFFKQGSIAMGNEKLMNSCWSDLKIQIARKVRNSLAHSGGRLTKDLLNINHYIRVEGDTLQVVPNDIRNLYDLVKVKTKLIVDWASQDPGFMDN